MSGPPPSSPTVTLLTMGRVRGATLIEGPEPLGPTTHEYGPLGHIQGAPGLSPGEPARSSRITVRSARSTVAAFVAAGLVDDGTARAGAAPVLRITAAVRTC
ncbi:hypothetical protein KYY02_05380 [Streptomyces pimonensis]|uniref:Uncharacterized protein n=1 Tax=Streptomyces pimonensis TaxID=2860288 RepID=A0ABV4IU17_9ACTN